MSRDVPEERDGAVIVDELFAVKLRLPVVRCLLPPRSHVTVPHCDVIIVVARRRVAAQNRWTALLMTCGLQHVRINIVNDEWFTVRAH